MTSERQYFMYISLSFRRSLATGPGPSIGPQGYYGAHKSSTVPYPQPDESSSVFTSYFRFNTILHSTPKISSFQLSAWSESISHLSNACYMPRLFHLLHLITQTIFDEKYKLRSCSCNFFFRLSLTSSLLGPKHSPQDPLFKHFHLRISSLG